MLKKLLMFLRNHEAVDRWPAREDFLQLEGGLWEVETRHPNTRNSLLIVFEASDEGPSSVQFTYADAIIDSADKYERAARTVFARRADFAPLSPDRLVLNSIEIPDEDAIARGQFTLVFSHPDDEEGSYAAAYFAYEPDGIARND